LAGFRKYFDDDRGRYLDCLFWNTSFPNRYYNINSDQNLLPIGAAIAKNWLQGVQFILESGFSLYKETDMNDEFFPNSLSLAIDFGRTGIARYLLEMKADPNGFHDPDNEQSAPIFHAIEKNNLEVVKLLVENKASLDIENEARETPRYPLVSAALNRNPEITQYLLQNISTSTAIQQLWNVSSFFKSRSSKERALLAEIYDELTKNNPFRQVSHSAVQLC
jgi:ankyrin repeat protein